MTARTVRRVALVTMVSAPLWLGSASASAEIVSKLPGANGLPFPAQLIDASADGRYVLIELWNTPQTPSATAPEADVDGLGPYFIRDRVADTTTPFIARAAPGSPALAWAVPTSISDDGNRVLYSGAGGQSRTIAVFDRRADRSLDLPTAPSWVEFPTAHLSADGTQAVLADLRIDPFGWVYFRGPIGGAATEVLDLPDARVTGMSRDLQTLAYVRTLPSVRRPSEELGRTNSVSTQVVGVKHGDAPPRIVDETQWVETPPPPGTACTNASIRRSIAEIGEARVAANGGRLGWGKTSYPGPEKSVEVRWSDGRRESRSWTGPYTLPSFTVFGDADELLLDYPLGEYAEDRLELVDADTELIRSVKTSFTWGDPSPYATRYVSAEPFDGAPVPQPQPISFTDEPVDTADRRSQATWYSCPAAPADAPIGAFDRYVSAALQSGIPTYSSRHRIGSLEAHLTPSSELRAATSVTAEVVALGVSIWKRRVSTSSEIYLPKPPFGLPVTLRVTVQLAAAPGEKTPAPLVRGYSIWALSNR